MNHSETFTWTGTYRTLYRHRLLVASTGPEFDAARVIPVDEDPDGWEVRLDVPVGTEVTVDYLEWEPS